MRSKSVVSFLLLAVSMAGVGWGRSIVSNPQVMVLVFDRSGISPTVLLEAERQAAKTFRRADIDVTWLNCSAAPDEGNEPCQEVQRPNQFVLNIVNRSKQPTNDIFGIAFLGEDGSGNYVDIFLDQITRFRNESGTKESDLLAAVSAHEIGHLLLGLHSHSPWGVMSPRWEGAHLRSIAMGTLSFTPEQVSIMRTRIASMQLE